ncbi:MAG: gliding motility-associated C-terminal domain-containing protein, partial [Bacteroidota bacterium]
DTPTSIEITNSDEQNVPFNGESGTVTISDQAVGENAVTLSIESKEVSTGEFCLDVTSTDFNDIIGLQFTIDYDPAILTFVRTDNFGLAGLDANQFANPSAGKITLTWVDQDLSGETLPDGTTVFSVCFTTIETSGNTMVSFSGTPTAIEVTQKDGNSEVAVDLTAVNSTVTISNVQPPEILEQATITDETCAGDNDGAIDVTVQGGTGSFTYSWSFQNETTEDLTGLPAGTYDLTVTDVNSSLTATRSFTVNGPASPISIDEVNINNPQCSGDNTGAIIITASGGTGNLSYTWNSGLPPGASQVNLSPSSNYRVSVADENGCNAVSDAIEIVSPDPLQATYSVNDVSCSGSNDGSISVNASGGTGNYTFAWSGGLSGDGNSQNNLGEGDYFVTITDENSCTFASPSISITNPNPINVGIGSFTDIEEGSNSGALVINVAGGSGSYTYSWSGPNNFNASTRSIQNLSTAGEYCVTVTDGSNCSIEECFNVYEALTFDDILLNNTCSGVSGGSIELIIAGGESPYNYNWSNGGNSSLVTGLAQGSYNVTVTDQRGVEIKGTFEINELDALEISGTIVEVTGNPLNSNGGVNLTISGGRPGYTVNWSNGATGQALTNVTAGQYCVTVTDENNCTIEDCFDVTYRPEPLSVTPRFDNVSCFGEENGNLFLIIQGGATPYKITFSDGEEVENTNGLVNRLNISGGEIGYVVEDGVGAVIEGSVLIQEPDSLQVVDIAITHDLEGESCTGVIDLTIQGGTPGYIVNWNSPNTGARIIGLCPGEYVPMIQDANGCTVAVDPITVNEFAVSGLISSADCEDSRNGSIALSVSGGEGPYVYSWSNEAGEIISTDQDPGELLPGAYTVTVSETSGNQIIKDFVVDASSNINVEVEVLSDFNGFTVSCANATDGMIRAQGVNGEGNYAYEWMRGNVMVSTTSTLENAAPGVYEVIAIDENGCVATMEVELSAPPAFNVSSSVTDVNCNGERDGEILLVPAGGIGANYSYSWSNNLPARNIQRNLAAGTYVVTITDENNCSEEFTYNVVEPAPLSISVQADSATERFNGEVRIIASGGTQPYSYFWEQIPTETSSSVGELQPGRYMVIVRDANGCDITGIGEVKNRISPCLSARIIITPNGDGQNDAFQVACSDLLLNNNLKIYNRWGQLVFEADNYLDDWEGTTSNGSDLPDGPYFYVLEYDDPSLNTRVQIEGSITLLREQ